LGQTGDTKKSENVVNRKRILELILWMWAFAFWEKGESHFSKGFTFLPQSQRICWGIILFWNRALKSLKSCYKYRNQTFTGFSDSWQFYLWYKSKGLVAEESIQQYQPP